MPLNSKANCNLLRVLVAIFIDNLPFTVIINIAPNQPQTLFSGRFRIAFPQLLAVCGVRAASVLPVMKSTTEAVTRPTLAEAGILNRV
jgi:hypothetical protein